MRPFIFLALVGFSWAFPSSEDDLEAAQWVTDTFANFTKETQKPALNLDPVMPENEVTCMTENNEQGVCTIYYLCDPDSRTLITDGTTLIDVRERVCPHYLEVCCLQSKRLPEETRFESTTAKTSNMADRFTSPTEVTPTPVISPQAKAACGWSSALTSIFKPTANNDDRVLANFGEFPWMVALLLKQKKSSVWNSDDYLGGGSLIHPSVVLTVAHKVMHNNQTLKCRAGEWDTQTTREQFPFQERDVTDKLLHPKFSLVSVKYDFALLFLASPFELAQAPHVGVACLARALPSPGSLCFSMGWGVHANNGTYADVLKKIRQQLVSPEACAQELKESYGPFFRVHKSLTCAVGAGGLDTCTGDGGSSLVCPVDKSGTGEQRYVVVGMVAYGVSCGLENVPAVYANVPKAVAWIDKVLAERGLPALENVAQ